MTQQPDLNHLRDLYNANARSGNTTPRDASRKVFVDPSGTVVVGTPDDGRQPLSEVHQGVFSGEVVIRERVAAEGTAAPLGATGTELEPVTPSQQVVVQQDGTVELVRSDQTTAALTEVHQGVFSAPPRAQAAVAAAKLPPSTRWIEDAHAKGWLYSITNDLGDDYTFFVYHQPQRNLFFAMMVLPEVPQRPDPRVAHYFQNGGLCLAHEVGVPTLDGCFAKTVLFSIGWSTYVRTGVFPFAGAH